MPPVILRFIENAVRFAVVQEEQMRPYLEELWLVFKVWWWVFPPFILWGPLKFMWLWWRQGLWDNKQKKILLEIKIPEDSLKPIRAMEPVLNGFWQLYSPPNWYEKWWEGQFLLWFSFEIVSLEGTPHFYIRMPERYRNIAESHIYSQYPEAEITVVDDYVKKVPPDIPSKDWEMWGADYRILKSEAYPIRTYVDFETEHEAKEEKRVDPMASLLEGMAKIGPGEQLWVQIMAKPYLGDPTEGERDWKAEARKIRDLEAKRTKKEKPMKLMIEEMWDLLIHAKPPGQAVEEEKEMFPAELKLTPGERDVVAGIERKISKLGFECNVRYIYLAKRDVFFGGHVRMAMSYFTNFISGNLNAMVPWGKMLTKIKRNWYNWFWFVKRRLYLKKRQLFRRYCIRVTPLFPLGGGTFILNSEELATIYHFPSRIVAPAATVPRVEARKGEAPANLPIE